MGKIPSSVQHLQNALRDIPRGTLNNDEAALINNLLSQCWHELEGAGETSMAAYKLGRAEQLSWCPPCLSFTIERHGATVQGSTRGTLQRWTANLETLQVTYEEGGHRQLYPTAARLDVRPIAQRILTAVQKGRGSDSEFVRNRTLVWKDANTLVMEPGRLLLADGYKQTIDGRRKRLRTELLTRVGELGWRLERGGRFMLFKRAV
jgi:hypothetical protein